MEYHEIRNAQDVSDFLSETNGLHDGYIVSANYQHQGYVLGNPMLIDPQKSKLVLNVMVTSINNTLVELVFEDIRNFQIKDANYDLLDSSIVFSEDGSVTWCGDYSCEPDVLRDANYVAAGTMKWRIVLQYKTRDASLS